MGFQEVASLDADVTVALGKVDKKGKAYPKSAEGYYLGSRKVQNKRGESTLHFLQTSEGNLGVWGTTDLNRKLNQAVPGTMVRITSTGTKPTPNGDMYTYKVEQDKANTIEVAALSEGSSTAGEDTSYSNDEDSDDTDEDADYEAATLAKAKQEAALAKVRATLNKNKTP